MDEVRDGGLYQDPGWPQATVGYRSQDLIYHRLVNVNVLESKISSPCSLPIRLSLRHQHRAQSSRPAFKVFNTNYFATCSILFCNVPAISLSKIFA